MKTKFNYRGYPMTVENGKVECQEQPLVGTVIQTVFDAFRDDYGASQGHLDHYLVLRLQQSHPGEVLDIELSKIEKLPEGMIDG